MLSLFELSILFLVYAFLGWVLETVTAALKHKRFVNRGLINSPFCIIYGIAAVVITVFLKDLSGVWLFLFAAIYATVIEWIAGHLIEKLFHEKWWDYSGLKYNLDGYICLRASLLWGILSYLGIRFGNHFLLSLIELFPAFIVRIIVFVLLAGLTLDALASYYLLSGKGRHLERWNAANHRFIVLSAKLEQWIYKQVKKRIDHAYPDAVQKEDVSDETDTFAKGCSFYKIVLLFFIGAFLGDITETIFCRITAGVWMSRSSVVIGPFSLVWGFALALATALLHRYKDSSDRFLFFTGTFLGGAYEYLCSVFTEIVFGQVFWDYSHIPFNLGGRINLLYCFFWGFAAVIWMKKIYPLFSDLIEKIPKKPGSIITWCCILFMIYNILLSSAAMLRYNARQAQIPASNSVETWIDLHYDDERMQKIYPNAIAVKPS